MTCLWLQALRSRVAVSAPAWPQSRVDAWVWLGWWVPIASLFVPFQVVSDVLSARRRSSRNGLLLGVWWFAWLTAHVAGVVRFLYVDDEGTASACSLTAAAGFAVALACWLAIGRQLLAAPALTGEPGPTLTGTWDARGHGGGRNAGGGGFSSIR